MEKNINQTWGIGDTILCILIFVCMLLPVISIINKANRIEVLEETIKVQDEMIKVRDKTINFQDSLISEYEILIIKIIKYE